MSQLMIIPEERHFTASGIDCVGEIPWGSHFCHFYKTSNDLNDILVPFFKTGFDCNERCIWVTSEPFDSSAARARLHEAVPDLATREAAGQIEILGYDELYQKKAEGDVQNLLRNWIGWQEQALRDGYNGLRISGNSYFLKREGWAGFKAYEAAVNALFRQRRIIGLCSSVASHELKTPHSRHGFGLGLWIVKQVVHAMKGELQLWSRPGDGAEFTVVLPLNSQQNPQEPSDGAKTYKRAA